MHQFAQLRCDLSRCRLMQPPSSQHWPHFWKIFMFLHGHLLSMSLERGKKSRYKYCLKAPTSWFLCFDRFQKPTTRVYYTLLLPLSLKSDGMPPNLTPFVLCFCMPAYTRQHHTQLLLFSGRMSVLSPEDTNDPDVRDRVRKWCDRFLYTLFILNPYDNFWNPFCWHWQAAFWRLMIMNWNPYAFFFSVPGVTPSTTVLSLPPPFYSYSIGSICLSTSRIQLKKGIYYLDV